MFPQWMCIHYCSWTREPDQVGDSTMKVLIGGGTEYIQAKNKSKQVKLFFIWHITRGYKPTPWSVGHKQWLQCVWNVDIGTYSFLISAWYNVQSWGKSILKIYHRCLFDYCSNSKKRVLNTNKHLWRPESFPVFSY